MTTQYTTNFGLAMPDFRSGPWHDLVNGDFSKIDSLLYGALSPAGTEVWANNKHFEVGVSVLDSDDATTWMCNVAHTTPATGTFADERAAQPTYWVQLLAGFAPRGEWQNSTNYYPYDMAYQSSVGVLAICKIRHVSNSAGTILDDAAVWSFLVNFSDIGATGAIAVSYAPSGNLTATNVQAAIDQAEAQIIALNNVNVTQGNQITALQNTDVTHATRMTNIETKNTNQDTSIATNATGLANLTTTVNSKATDAAVVHKAGDAMTGRLDTKISGTIVTAGPVPSILVNGAANDYACISFLSANVFGANFGLHPNGDFYMGGWSYGGNAYKFWTTRDFATVPTPGVTQVRLVFAGDVTGPVYGGGVTMSEPRAGAVITGAGWGAVPVTGDIATANRYRYLQYFINGNWVTAAYA